MSTLKLITCNGVLLEKLVDQNSLLPKKSKVWLYSDH